ncbi:GntR family transcriptional regulator [Halomonas sp. McH1-25]|uniref:GntR family transcriptional regulator n=1 Tax=unclassified Halomonas TaxID=2609666 RepID=UPI001EF70FE4|nr:MULTISPECIES: GntR family transcriptional regulator [unclassified Halomonas]MCG7600128.1 GntR family transcriptional regulator [Halomonas sp. McH1-25]MCP1341377.1 GntR family transcriptional regulator [Halomonas sp. FL8]MCP1359678.1 GntR family transcriptional regulator [Halomonas sp. BBD45]MCP1365325.1 GntR family transcriptional regulator [Halomonas sp. BBD48]
MKALFWYAILLAYIRINVIIRMEEIEPTSRAGLVEKVADYLREHIVMDHFQPGQRLPERTLAEKLKVSRTPMREALKILATEGLVVISPHRGAVVADVSPADMKEKAYVLSVLEQAAAELACVKASDDDIAELQALHFEMKAAFLRRDRQNYFRLNQEIHNRIVSLSGNASLVEIHANLSRQLYRVRYLSNQKNDKWSVAMEEHEAIMAAMEARDAERIGRELRNHLGKTWVKYAHEENVQDDNRVDPHLSEAR